MVLKSHLTLAHTFWEMILSPGDDVVDATVGGGFDALFLAQKTLAFDGRGSLTCFDIQDKAIKKSQNLLEQSLDPAIFSRIDWRCASHEHIIDLSIEPKLIVFNFGYLPGGDKSVTTMTSSSLVAVEASLTKLKPGGFLSLTLYPGHEEGEKEMAALLNLTKELPKSEWIVTQHSWINRRKNPILILIQKIPPPPQSLS